MPKQKLTPWFSGSVKPIHHGVYETYEEGGYQYWDGEKWGYFTYSIERAYQHKGTNSMEQHNKWRGLAEKPED